MGVTLEVYDSGSGQWVDKTLKTIQFRHSLTSRELEKVEFTLVNDDVNVGQKVRAKRNDNIFFRGHQYMRGVSVMTRIMLAWRPQHTVT
jgi:hypothetical protein